MAALLNRTTNKLNRFHFLACRTLSSLRSITTPPQLPPFDHQPQPYNGPFADQVFAKRKTFPGPSLFHYYQKPAVVVGSLINLATILSLNSIREPATIAYLFCAIFGFQVLFGIVKIKKLDERERLITGTA